MRLSDLLAKIKADASLRTGQQFTQGCAEIVNLLERLQFLDASKYGGLGMGESKIGDGKKRRAGSTDGDSVEDNADVRPVKNPFALEVSSSKVHVIDKLDDGAFVKGCFNAASTTTHASASPQCTVLLARINELTELEFCASLPELRFLDVSHNYLTSIDGIAHSAQLRYADCSGNLLRRIDFSKAAPASIRVLNLGHNKITRLDGLDECENLKELDLSHNRLKGDIEEWTFPESLEVLKLSDNEISGVAGISTSVQLKVLDLSRNAIIDTTHFEQLLFACKILTELEQLDIRGNAVYEGKPEGMAGDGDFETGSSASKQWRQQQSAKRRTRHFFEVISVAGGEKGLSLFNGKVILPTTKSELKRFHRDDDITDIITHTTDRFTEMIRDVERERDSKLEALERQRQILIASYQKSIDGVNGELQRTIEFLQALKEPDHDEAVRYASELIEASIDTARQKGWKGFTKQEEEGGPAAEDADEAFLSDFLDKMDSPQKSLGDNAGAPSADGAKVDDARAKAHAQLVRKGLLKNSLKTIVNTNRMLRRKRGSDAGPRTDAMATLAAALSSSSGVSTQFAEMSGEEGEGASAEQSGSADEELASSSAQSSPQSKPATEARPAPASTSISASQATDEERERAHAQLVRMGILKGNLRSILRAKGVLNKLRSTESATSNQQDYGDTKSVVRSRLEGAVAAGRSGLAAAPQPGPSNATGSEFFHHPHGSEL